MNNDFVILSAVERKENREIVIFLDNFGFEILPCVADEMEIISRCCAVRPAFVMLEAPLFQDMLDRGLIIFIKKLDVKIIILCNSANKINYPSAYIITCRDDVNKFIYSIFTDIEIRAKQKELFRKNHESYMNDLIEKSLEELCFLKNYIGTFFIRDILRGVCMEEIKFTDSMSKIIYPYVAKNYLVSPESVERNIRTVIQKCWDYSDKSIKIKYLGEIFFIARKMPDQQEITRHLVRISFT